MNKSKETAKKNELSPQFLYEEKLTFQRTISTAVFEHDISTSLIVNLDQTLLS